MRGYLGNPESLGLIQHLPMAGLWGYEETLLLNYVRETLTIEALADIALKRIGWK